MLLTERLGAQEMTAELDVLDRLDGVRRLLGDAVEQGRAAGPQQARTDAIGLLENLLEELKQDR